MQTNTHTHLAEQECRIFRDTIYQLATNEAFPMHQQRCFSAFHGRIRMNTSYSVIKLLKDMIAVEQNSQLMGLKENTLSSCLPHILKAYSQAMQEEKPALAKAKPKKHGNVIYLEAIESNPTLH